MRLKPMMFGISAALAFCWLAAGTQSVQAQVTAEALIGKSVSDITESMSKPIEEAITLFKNRQFDDARNKLKATCQAHPQLPPAGVIMAQMFVAANQGLAARGELERCVLASPSDPEPYLVFGDLAFQNRQVTESGLCFDKANDLAQAYSANPKRKRNLQIRAYAGQAAVAAAREQHTLEEQLLTKWIGLEPDSTAGYTRLARCQYKQGGKENVSRAYATFGKLYDEIDQEKDPAKKVPRPEINMAIMYTQDKLIDNAKKLMDLAMQRAAKDDINTRLAVSQWALENGDVEMAKEAAAAAYQVDPDSLQAMLLLGVAARYEGDAAKAEQWFRAAHAKTPSNFAVINNLALTLIEQPDETKRRQALEFAQLNQRVNSNLQTPAGREAAATLSWAAFRLGQEANAERGILQVLQSGSISNEAAYHAAQILNDRGRSQQARQILEPLVKQSGYFPGKDDAKTLLAKLASEGDLLPNN